jgi:hypothetical protein
MDGYAKYSLGWNLGIFAIQGSGDQTFSLGLYALYLEKTDYVDTSDGSSVVFCTEI